jgi:hypothetical protein
VIEAKLFLELLMRLLAQPARLDGCGERLQRGLRRQVREVGSALPLAINSARLRAHSARSDVFDQMM